jgi:hypothetical protein
MVVRELVALLGVKSDSASFNKAEGGMNKLAGVAKAAAAAFAALKITQFIRGAVVEVATLGDQFDKMSKRSGIATSALQGLGHAAELSGASMNTVEVAIKKLQAAQVEAADGVATYADEFKRMGLDIKNEDGTLKETTQLLAEMADGMNNLETDSERTAVAMKLLGRSGTQLIPMFAEGTEGIAAMVQEMSDLGGIIDDELIGLSADYIDNVRRMDVVTLGIKNTIAKELLPVINKNTDAFIKWWKINGQIIRQRVANAFKQVARVMGNMVRFGSRIVKFFTQLVGKMSPLEKGILAVGVAIVAIGKLLAMGPIGKFLLLATIIALIIDDFETWRAGGKSVIGDLVKALDTLLGVDVTGWVTAMVDFFEDGWQAIKVGAGAIFQTIFALVKFLINVWEDPKKAWHDFTWELRLIWDELWDYVEGDGAAIVDAFMNTFIAPVGELFKMLTADIKGFFNELFEDIVSWSERTTQAVLSPFVKAKEFLSGLLGTDSVVKVKGVLDNSNLQAVGSVARTGAGARTQERVRARIGALTPL